MTKTRELHILLVDDDATDRELFADAVAASGYPCLVSEAANGAEALSFLKAAASLPHLILLDLNMPIKDGRETLLDIKGSEAYRSIPVCILSTSSAHFDIANAYNAGANFFLVKPFDYQGLVEMLSSLLSFFGNYVALPHRAAPRSEN